MKSKQKNSYINSDHQETKGLPNPYLPEFTPTIPAVSDSDLELTKDARFVKELIGKDIKRLDGKIVDVKETIKEKSQHLEEKIDDNKESIRENKKIFNRNFKTFWIILAIAIPILFFVTNHLVNKEDSNKISTIATSINCFKDSVRIDIAENSKFVKSKIDSLKSDINKLKPKVDIVNSKDK